jgi:hypothetical protein
MIATQALYFSIGWVFLVKKLTKDYDVSKHKMVQLVFAATFTISCQLFQLIIFEILDIGHREYVTAHDSLPFNHLTLKVSMDTLAVQYIRYASLGSCCPSILPNLHSVRAG